MKTLLQSIAIGTAVLLICSCGAAASEPRTLTVSGTGRIYTEPDEAALSFTLYTKDTILIEAKRKNNVLLKKLNDILQVFNIEQQYLSLDYSTVNPEYSYHRQTEERIMTGYSVRQNISIRLKDISQYEAFVEALLEAGIDTINRTSFSNSEMEQYRNQARAKAVETAFKKAELLCKEASTKGRPVKLRKVLHITELNGNKQERYNAAKQKYANRKEALNADTADENGMPLGVIAVEAAVEIVFALK